MNCSRSHRVQRSGKQLACALVHQTITRVRRQRLVLVQTLSTDRQSNHRGYRIFRHSVRQGIIPVLRVAHIHSQHDVVRLMMSTPAYRHATRQPGIRQCQCGRRRYRSHHQ